MSSQQTVVADTILHNGKIWCGHAEGVSEALAIWNGKVIARGDSREILKLEGEGTRIIDLDGKFATPGLNDSHLHLISLGLTLSWIDATPQKAPTLDALLDAIRVQAAVCPPGTWIRARGYDQTKLDIGRHPYKHELDSAAPDHPVMLVRACGHVSIFNSKAFALAGVDEDTPVPEGGVIEQQDGALTGMVAETAQRLIRRAIPGATTDEMIDAIQSAGDMLLSYGITSVMDAAVGQVGGFDEMRAYNLAKLSGRLPVRAWLVLLGDPGNSIVDQCHAAGLISGVGDDMLRVGAVKIFLDGSAGGKTAWMFEPYLGEERTTGVQILQDEELEALVMDTHEKGYQLACHAIGDAAIGQLITAYEMALAAMPDADRRHRIEHCGFSSPAQHERMKKAGIYPCPQQVFIYDFGDAYVSVLGEERALSSYPLKTWRDLGFRPATGSDAPVCHPNPFPNIYSMLTRKTWKGTVMDERERVTIEEALQSYTEYGAFSQKMENEKGRLVPGQVADIAVFSRDMLTAAPEDILNDTECVMTLRGGEVVFVRQ
ncbi:amidohydrolase [Nitratireductor aquimarinus]|uniref:amidohydrolase n=1 Tax=Nitratireductor TaxID=245876 RepID=UPI0019D39C53|nr:MULTISPECIES: amidohydrolase [Nitratireductor]MBN7776570.1 amidohydrolase [Nitratireductor pacificus]MBN7779437.1 amidohydrolase [Nitratireductor pacificus]MBN7788244.1 amidohydrolase [Nitratireductor aquimarinus]MBY6098291.1 amidohydrolase [Nitratireductor aquimarinus]MCA1259270.1 amidohydrolase [Nitratireductor aquimarinus]